jgi:hypothetical protein
LQHAVDVAGVAQVAKATGGRGILQVPAHADVDDACAGCDLRVCRPDLGMTGTCPGVVTGDGTRGQDNRGHERLWVHRRSSSNGEGELREQGRPSAPKP